MIDRRFARAEAVRLKAIDKWIDAPDNKPALDELVAAIMTAKNEAIAVAAMNDWLENQSKLPAPADLRKLIRQENEREGIQESDAARRTRDCLICRGAGFEFVERGGYSGAKPCRCRIDARREAA